MSGSEKKSSGALLWVTGMMSLLLFVIGIYDGYLGLWDFLSASIAIFCFIMAAVNIISAKKRKSAFDRQFHESYRISREDFSMIESATERMKKFYRRLCSNENFCGEMEELTIDDEPLGEADEVI